jgi:hypothetical protein
MAKNISSARDELGGIDEHQTDAERLDRVIHRLAERASAATGEYVQYFQDRLDLARRWQQDF